MLIVGVACRLCAVWKQARCCGCDVRGNGRCSLVLKFSQPTDILGTTMAQILLKHMYHALQSITIPRHAPRPPMIKTAGLVGFAGPAAESPIFGVWVFWRDRELWFPGGGPWCGTRDVLRFGRVV